METVGKCWDIVMWRVWYRAYNDDSCAGTIETGGGQGNGEGSMSLLS